MNSVTKRNRIPTPCLALVTDSSLFSSIEDLVRAVSLALDGGVDLVQLREKQLPAEALFALAVKLRAVTIGRAIFLINDRIDVALGCEADGVQIGEEGMPLTTVRSLLGQDLLMGCSTHGSQRTILAETYGADFLVAGSIFHSRTHPERSPHGLSLLSETCKSTRLPILAIGGITSPRVKTVLEAGASGIAVIQAILGSHDPLNAARGLRSSLDKSWESLGNGTEVQ